MNTRRSLLGFGAALLLLLPACTTLREPAPGETWRGVHLWLDRENSAQQLIRTLPALAQAGVNVVVIEVNYSYEFRNHPELRNRHYITRQTAHALAAAARHSDIWLIPEFNCLGHQSFGGRIEPLLRTHPEWSETPTTAMQETNFYSLSWCPLAPGLTETVCSLMDDLAEGFEAEAIHVGMDEVYYIGDDRCPRCRGKNPAALFTEQVQQLHSHIVTDKKWQMLMWADRVIGVKFQGWSKFDTLQNDLSAAADTIPRDIIQCDWHYEKKVDYPSIPYLAGKGFRVWPAGFLPLPAAQALSHCALTQRTNVIGYLATTWNETRITNAPAWPPIREILPQWKQQLEPTGKPWKCR